MTEISSYALLEADGTYYVKVQEIGDYRVQVGDKQNQNFGGGTVTVKQEGLTYDQFSVVSAVTARRLTLDEGTLEFVVSGSTSPSLRVSVKKVQF